MRTGRKIKRPHGMGGKLPGTKRMPVKDMVSGRGGYHGGRRKHR